MTIGPYSQHLSKAVPKLYFQSEVVRQRHTKTEIRLRLSSNSVLVLKTRIKFLAIVSSGLTPSPAFLFWMTTAFPKPEIKVLATVVAFDNEGAQVN